MLDIPIKSPGTNFFSDECNALSGELENAITATGQTLTGADLFQLSKSLTNSTGRADFYTDSGIVNAYQLAPQAGIQAPTAYLSGLRVRFQVANSNNGPSTIQIGSLGLKPIKKDDNTSDLDANDLIAGKYAELVYDQANDIFELLVLHEKSTSTDTIRAAGQGYLPFGMGIEFVSSTQFQIQPGNIKATNDNSVQIFLETAMTKNITVSWAEGDGQGCLAEGLILQSSTYYYLFTISKPNGQSDFVLDDNAAGTNVFGVNVTAAGYVNNAEIWRMKTNSVSQLDQWVRFDNEYWFENGFDLGLFTGPRPYNIPTKCPPKCVGIYSFSKTNIPSEIHITPDFITAMTIDTPDSVNISQHIPTLLGSIGVRQSGGSPAAGVDVRVYQLAYIYMGAFN